MNLIINETIADILFSEEVFSNEEIGVIIRSVYKYSTEDVPDMSGNTMVNAMCKLLCKDIDKQREAFQTMVQRQHDHKKKQIKTLQ